MDNSTAATTTIETALLGIIIPLGVVISIVFLCGVLLKYGAGNVLKDAVIRLIGMILILIRKR